MTPTAPTRRRLAINQATVPNWTTVELLDGAARAGYGAVGLWRDRLAEIGAGTAARRARELGIEISSLCRGGWFAAADEAGSRERMEDNFRAVEEAAELEARVLVLVCGPAATRDLTAGRARVVDAVSELSNFADTVGVQLGVEPMHPMYCGDRSVIVTLDQARELGVGVVVDSYHVWWDPHLEAAISACGERILSFQLADWLAPPPDSLNGRGMVGDGVIDFRSLKRAVDATGYTGPIEFEIFNPAVWALEPDDALELLATRYQECVA